MDSGPGGRTGARSACGCGQPAAERHRAAEQHRGAEQHQAAEQHRVERSAVGRAEIAAAEDFDPLRIRPYVTLGNDTVPAAEEERPDRPGSRLPVEEGAGARLPMEEGPGARLPMEDAATTMPLFLGRDPAGRPLPDTAGPADPSGPFDDQEPEPSHRRRPFAAAAVGVALIAVVGAAAFASGLLGGGGNGDADQRQALPGTVADVPGASVRATEPTASAPPSPSASAPASPSAPASASPSPSASTSPSSSASAASSQPPSPSPSRTTSGSPSAAPPASLAGAALHPGDQGPEVAELQRRLAELWLYSGRDDGTYSDQVERAVRVYQSYKFIEGDPSGVYGPHTRRALEAETTGRGSS
ncbi:peptidoglycan-binding domain-containing protein [Streptomyces sp. NPDC006641]|uniref:peptidoglycan-binding domain-containing protein n=1 Tax=unclassified Streptomyces TaxID=2593676 RepID=UPI002E76D6F3|nr:peptidoglycan-binding domain-containing protein [Streptomyces sp. JV184]MEE1749472.1 peptidoglycan-binding domain-containing protein [Streptomyces sp. JV184]